MDELFEDGRDLERDMLSDFVHRWVVYQMGISHPEVPVTAYMRPGDIAICWRGWPEEEAEIPQAQERRAA